MDEASGRRNSPRRGNAQIAKARLGLLRDAIDEWARPFGDDAKWLNRHVLGIRRWRTGGAMLVTVCEQSAKNAAGQSMLSAAMGSEQQAWLVGRAIAVLDTPAHRFLANEEHGIEGYDLSPWWLLVSPHGRVTEIPPRWPVKAAKSPTTVGHVAVGVPEGCLLAAEAPPPEARAAAHMTFCFPPYQSSIRSGSTA